MSTFATNVLLASDATFRNRLEGALVKAALNIVGEDSSTQHTSKRQDLGIRVLGRERADLLGHFAMAVCAANPSLGAAYNAANRTTVTIADVDIEETVSAVWNDMAGVKSV